jgi:hypothetical protein
MPDGHDSKYQKKSRPQLGPPAADCPRETHACGVVGMGDRPVAQIIERAQGPAPTKHMRLFPRAHASLGCAAMGFKTRNEDSRQMLLTNGRAEVQPSKRRLMKRCCFKVFVEGT